MGLLRRIKRAADGEPHGRESRAAAPEGAAATPLPEPRERRLEDPGPRELSRRDYLAILVRAAKEANADNIPDFAAAVAFRAFFAIPSALLIAVGVFSLVATEEIVETMLDRLGTVAPEEAVILLEDTLTRVIATERGWIAIAIGAALALWTVTGAMNGLVRALNVAYDREETRGFVKLRLTGLAMLVLVLLAVALVFVLLILGPVLSEWIGALLGLETLFKWIWWTAQWPILVAGLLFSFAGVLYLGANVDHPRWQFLTLGSAVAVVLWLAVSGGFALYVGMFGTYERTWGALAGVIVMLTWLWLSSLALLFSAEVNAEAERSRELRERRPAAKEIRAPAKA